MKGMLTKLRRAAVVGVIVLAVGGVGLVAVWPRPPKPPARIASVAELEAYLDQIIRFGRPPGLSLIVVKDGRTVYARGFGLADGPKHIAAAPDTAYRWYSMTKIPTAIAIFQLQEQGRLSLDDPVAKHLPFFKVQYPSAASRVVTIRHLLNHSSGLPDLGMGLFRWLHLESEPPVNQTAFVQKVLPDHATLAFEPGSRTAYCNLGYILLGAVIEKVTGQTYEDYIREHILTPLRMTHTDFVLTAAMRPHLAAGSHPVLEAKTPLMPLFVKHWGSLEREIDGGHLWFNPIYTDYTPSTGLIGDAPDVTRLLLAYLNEGELDGRRILTPSSLAAMGHSDRAVSKAPAHQGLGWVIACGERECLEHAGGGPGFGTAMRLYPRERLGIVVLTNDGTSDVNAILNLAAMLRWGE